MAPIIGWDLKCVCGARFLTPGQELFSSYEAAIEALIEVKASNKGFKDCADDDCFIYGIFTHAVEEGEESPKVNMSNDNSVSVLSALGLMADTDTFEDVCCGSVQADDFLGRILMALAVAPESAERPTIVTANENSATLIECGRPAGYVQDRLQGLLRVAEFCRRNGRDVVWS